MMEASMRSLSEDLRVRIIRARERGESSAVVAERYEVNIRTVQGLWKRYRESGMILAKQRGGYRISRVAAMEKTLRSWIKAEVDLTLAEMCDRLAEHGIVIGVPALWHQLDKWKLSLKKNPARQRARARRREGGANGVERKTTHA
jgi:transposase